MPPLIPARRPGMPKPMLPRRIAASPGGRVQPGGSTPQHKTKTIPDGLTGMPRMATRQELQAQANATAWKSISQMMGQLPDFNAVDQPYSAMRSAIAPLVDAHRDWLMKAGQYQTQMTNGLAQLVYQGAGAGDAAQAASAAAAGAPAGMTFAGNVSPGAASVIPTALGGSFANYLQSLIPYATAQGIGNVGRVNAQEQEALLKLSDAKRQIAGQYGDLQTKAFTALSDTAFNKYKSELAALAAGQKGDLETNKLKQKSKTDAQRIAIASRNADTAATRAQNTIRLGEMRGQATKTAADKKLLTNALLAADKKYNNLGGVKKSTPGKAGGGDYAFQITMREVFPPGNALAKQQKPRNKTFYGATPAAVRAQAQAYKQKHPALSVPGKPDQSGYWDSPKGVVKGPMAGGTSGSSQVVDRPSETTRRLRAWRLFRTMTSQLNQPLSDAALRNYFRSQFGDPPA